MQLLVIDGPDGSGKATQVKLLTERLRAEGYRVETIDFPRYTTNHFGRLIRQCLDGEMGDFMATHPKIASTLYAADRFESSKQIREWLDEEVVVVADRYVSSNMIHQGAKLTDDAARAEFLEWLDVTEHEVFGIPRPELIVHLHIPYSFRQKLMSGDGGRKALDVAELDHHHQSVSEVAAQGLVASFNNWQAIECVTDEELRSIEDIHEEVYRKVVDVLK